ncbi:branched-chain amino acid ABC transporter permease [Pseudonocardia pini]|uniref:branched-chain amino acid ABC transporter permease n=1 Tax=Pseudonocardia pini TaxID=2758030 RepID=UPI0015F006E7|nr:branched-chain amino acid ABC transporter permease [Pseudonocardia pini]
MTDPRLWLSVLEVGCFFALLGLAYLVVLQGSGFFNLAIGPYAMLAALGWTGLVVQADLDPLLALVVSLVAVVAVAVLTELVVVRPIERRSGDSEFPALVAVAALLFALSQGAGLLFGRLPLPGQRLLDIPPVRIGDLALAPSSIVLVGLTVVAFGGIAILARRTPMGRALRAVGDNRQAARLLGLRVGRVRLAAFAVSGLLAAVAGIGFASRGGVTYDIGLHWALLGFLAVVIGGTGSWFAPLVGGLVLGLAEVMVPYYSGGQYADYAVLLCALLFFGFRPNGIFTRAVRV